LETTNTASASVGVSAVDVAALNCMGGSPYHPSSIAPDSALSLPPQKAYFQEYSTTPPPSCATVVSGALHGKGALRPKLQAGCFRRQSTVTGNNGNNDQAPVGRSPAHRAASSPSERSRMTPRQVAVILEVSSLERHAPGSRQGWPVLFSLLGAAVSFHGGHRYGDQLWRDSAAPWPGAGWSVPSGNGPGRWLPIINKEGRRAKIRSLLPPASCGK
jgi:hypothetical protein